MQRLASRIVGSALFQRFIIAVIILNGITIGAETNPHVAQTYGHLLKSINDLILAIFVAEVILKITAVWPRPQDYFRDGWNVFDFLIVAVSLMPGAPQFATVARLLRLLRVIRLVSALPQLRLIVGTLVRSIPGMANVILLMSIIFYVYAVAGFHLFHEHDPTHWRSLGIPLLTLFRVVTLEDWTDVMYKAMEMHPLAWIYFVSFVICGTFVVINLFVAVVLNNLEEVKHEDEEEHIAPINHDQLYEELRRTREALALVEKRLQASEARPDG